MPNFRIEHHLDSRPVSLAPGILILSPLMLHVEDWEGYDLVLGVVALPASDSGAGRLVCGSLTAKQRDDGPPVTTEAMRGIPVATLVRGVGAREWLAAEGDGPATDRRLDAADVERFKREGPTDEVLRWVAKTYRMALVLGDSPTKAVEDQLELPRSTAGRWVAMARDKGYLGKAEGPGKAGG